MFEIAMELASHDKFYEDMAVKFADHFHLDRPRHESDGS
jgi:hypothetical protein